MSGRVNDGDRFWKSVVQQSDKSVEPKDWLEEWVRREFDFLVEEFVRTKEEFLKRRKKGLLYIPSYKEI